MRFAITLLLCVLFFNLNAQSTASKNVHQFKIEAPQLDTIRNIWVYLPEDYKESEKRYPVIYMHDAQNLFDAETSFVGEWNVDEVLDSIHDQKSIIVGIEHGGNERINELTPFANEQYGGGKADAYLSFLRNTLKPHIDITYRTLPDKEHTGIMGSSLGGLVSFYAAFKYPETFSKIGVFSPSFWFSEKIYDLVENSELPKDQSFYFLGGTKESADLVSEIKKMHELLLKNGISSENIKMKFIEGGEHNEELWRSNFEEAYLWLITKK